MGGEKAALVIRFNGGIGSPPRGRGKAFGNVMVINPIGITPAWAGKRLKQTGLTMQD